MSMWRKRREREWKEYREGRRERRRMGEERGGEWRENVLSIDGQSRMAHSSICTCIP